MSLGHPGLLGVKIGVNTTLRQSKEEFSDSVQLVPAQLVPGKCAATNRHRAGLKEGAR